MQTTIQNVGPRITLQHTDRHARRISRNLGRGASGVALSGAGPTVIGLVAGDTDEIAHQLAEEIAQRAADRVRELGTRRSPEALRIDRAGARIL